MPCGCLQIFATGCRETEASLASAITLYYIPTNPGNTSWCPNWHQTRRQLLVTHLQLNAPKSCEFFANAQFVCVNTFVRVIEPPRPGKRQDRALEGMH